MEFIIFLSKLDKEILELVMKVNYAVEENSTECLLNKKLAGLHKFEENKIIICTENAKKLTNYRDPRQNLNIDNFRTEKVIKQAFRHEVTHIAQKCNNDRAMGNREDLEKRIHKTKRKALVFSTRFSASNYEKELEAYVLELKPKKVKEAIKKYCL